MALEAGLELYCKRDDLFTPASGTALQGNKVRKLAPVLRAAFAVKEAPVLVSFGGAFSNHLSALSTAGRIYGLRVVIYVRGEEVDNPILQRAERDGATLIRLPRTEYRLKSDQEWLAARREELAKKIDIPPSLIWIIPEGGTDPKGLEIIGLLYQEVVGQLGRTPDYLCLSSGTGGTAAGLIAVSDPLTCVEVYPALKGNWMSAQIGRLLPAGASSNWKCIPDYHYGGYGKFPDEWIVPSSGLAKRAVVGEGLPPLEPVYTAKLFAGVLDRVRKGLYPQGSSVVVVHTGGIY